jgi:hypothetical protein
LAHKRGSACLEPVFNLPARFPLQWRWKEITMTRRPILADILVGSRPLSRSSDVDGLFHYPLFLLLNAELEVGPAGEICRI